MIQQVRPQSHLGSATTPHLLRAKKYSQQFDGIYSTKHYYDS